MKRILLAGMIAALALGPAMAQETCAAKAVDQNGKPLAGAALNSFLKKCKREACEPKAVSAEGKKLSGAAKNSFMQKCERDAWVLRRMANSQGYVERHDVTVGMIHVDGDAPSVAEPATNQWGKASLTKGYIGGTKSTLGTNHTGATALDRRKVPRLRKGYPEPDPEFVTPSPESPPWGRGRLK